MFETSEEIAQNKLILLYLLDKINISMTNAEMCQFALEKQMMDYFAVQNCLEELVFAKLLEKYKENNLTWYKITAEGKEMLNLFIGKIPVWMRNETQDYINQNGERLKNQFEINTSVEIREDGDYFVSCKIYGAERSVMMEVGIALPEEKYAKDVCANWEKNAEDIYLKVFNIMTEVKKTE